MAVGSGNPVKCNAVRRAFEANFPHTEIVIAPYDVPSGVPAQPWSNTETRQGAIARAQKCCAAHRAHGAAPDFGVGIEGGVCEEAVGILHPLAAPPLPQRQVSCFAFIAVVRGSDPVGGEANVHWGVARTASFPLPPRVVALMRGEGGATPMELGDADDAIFGDSGSKRKGGTIGKATHGLIDRTAYYVHALHCALVPFVHDDTGLYDAETSSSDRGLRLALIGLEKALRM